MAKELNLFEKEFYQQDAIANPSSVVKEDESRKLSDILTKIKMNQELQQQDREAQEKVKRTIEALLFASSEPIPFQKIREITDTIYPYKPKKLQDILGDLAQEYIKQNRAFRLEEIAQGYLLRTCPELSPYVDHLYRNRRAEKLSHAATEVLAIIAYRQPITRPHIEAIRGVDCTGTLQNLLERQLIEPVGKLEAPGRPTLYGITQDFLKHFGLRDLKDLTGDPH